MAAPEEGTPTGEVDPLAQGAGEPPLAEESAIEQEHDLSAQGTPHPWGSGPARGRGGL